ncbi:helix-turn-helix transcriptional regulator [Brevundimonas diminuta]|uniref:helix-turn-helix transcriptional regulator n=1 Tax=Brevundimonas diminuta TaxID=293 RepID=UPI003CFD2FE6
MSRSYEEVLSDAIGAIYDCVLNPDLWPATLAVMGNFLDCSNGTLVMTDLAQQRLRTVKSWNFEAALIERLPEFSAESAQVWSSVTDLWARDLNEPGSSMREAPEAFSRTRWATEVMQPRGLVDSLHMIVLREPSRIADIALYRERAAGLCDEQTLNRARLLTPHLRRAVAMSSILDMQKVERNNWKSLADTLSAGVFLISTTGRVADFNAAAETRIRQGGLLVERQGRLAAVRRNAATPLKAAIEQALLGQEAASTGVVLSGPDEPPVMAYVLSLKRINAGPIFGEAAAAVFVTPGPQAVTDGLEAISAMVGLTLVERVHLRHILSGLSVPETARREGVSPATANTYRHRIFRKFNVTRRAELEKLFEALRSPASRL